MRDGSFTTMDPAGRIIIPKAVRDAAELRPGVPLVVGVVEGHIEITAEPRAVRIERRGKMKVAVPATPSEPLREATVRKTLESVRSRRGTSR